MSPTACGSLPLEGPLRLRPGKAGSAALAGMKPPRSTLIPNKHGLLRLRPWLAWGCRLRQ